MSATSYGHACLPFTEEDVEHLLLQHDDWTRSMARDHATGRVVQMLLRAALIDAVQAISEGKAIDVSSAKFSNIISEPDFPDEDGLVAWNYRFNAKDAL